MWARGWEREQRMLFYNPAVKRVRDVQYKGGWLAAPPGHELILSGPTNTATMLTYFCWRLPFKITHRANAIVNFASSLQKSAWENCAQVYIKKCINDTKGLVFSRRVSRIYPRRRWWRLLPKKYSIDWVQESEGYLFLTFLLFWVKAADLMQ